MPGDWAGLLLLVVVLQLIILAFFKLRPRLAPPLILKGGFPFIDEWRVAEEPERLLLRGTERSTAPWKPRHVEIALPRTGGDVTVNGSVVGQRVAHLRLRVSRATGSEEADGTF